MVTVTVGGNNPSYEGSMGIVLRFIFRFLVVAELCIGNIQRRLLWGIEYGLREGKP